MRIFQLMIGFLTRFVLVCTMPVAAIVTLGNKITPLSHATVSKIASTTTAALMLWFLPYLGIAYLCVIAFVSYFSKFKPHIKGVVEHYRHRGVVLFCTEGKQTPNHVFVFPFYDGTGLDAVLNVRRSIPDHDGYLVSIDNDGENVYPAKLTPRFVASLRALKKEG